MIEAILITLSITILIGLVLGYASIKLKTTGDPIVDKCGQCGYPGCKPYATAIANGEADINQCPPGGDDGIHKLADLLGVEYKPLNAEHGEPKPKSVAIIDESTIPETTENWKWKYPIYKIEQQN